MKQLLKLVVFIIVTAVSFSFEEKCENLFGENKNPASSNSVEVLDKWMEMQMRLMSTTVASFNGPFVRVYSYTGLACYASILPGIDRSSSYIFPLSELTSLPALPETEPGQKYHWPSSINASLAFMNRVMFPATSPSNKEAIDSLEDCLKKSFSKEVDSLTIKRSEDYGKLVAQSIYDWAETDGYKRVNDPYILPAGPGKWVPTPPNFAKPSTPYWGSLRPIVNGSLKNTEPHPPPDYSEDTLSAFYKMNKQVYDVDRYISDEQKAIVLFWRDINPGVTAPGHWINILRQVFKKENKNIGLDKAAFTYAITGIALNDAWISSWKTRYSYNLLRPVTYIRNVLGYSEWLPLLTTPPHPEYTAGFAAMAGAVCEALTGIFGSTYEITDHTYDYIGMKPRTYQSFDAIAEEAADSKFYGGIHYKLSVDAGRWQGKTVAQNIKMILLSKMKSARP